MNEYLINTAVLLILLGSMQLGMKSGAVSALTWMLTGVLSLFVAMRYWFLLCRLAVTYETLPQPMLPLLAILCFWVLFVLVWVAFMKLCDKRIRKFESVASSFLERLLGAVFGIVNGAVVAVALLLTFSILTPQYFSEKSTVFPIPLDSLPMMAFRAVETSLAQVPESDPAHTLLPRLHNTDPNPAVFWQ